MTPRRGGLEPSLAAVWISLLAFASPAAAATERARLPSGESAALVDRRDLFLESAPLAGEGLLAFCRRLTGSTERCSEIAQLNGRPKRLLAGVRYRIRFEWLTLDRRLAVVRALFPRDRAEPAGWIHRGRGEAVPAVALWFTGSQANAAELRSANGLANDSLQPAEEIRVPDRVLLSIFRVVATAPLQLPAPTVAAPVTGAPASDLAAALAVELAASSPGNGASDVALEYGSDALGPFATYRLRGGEALYSAVVVRLTGRDHADDVNALAREIAIRSGIGDVTDIHIGFPVKIALDLLLPQYLPTGDPRRLEWEVERRLAEQFRNPVQAKGLEGVTVVLDAGHGGADVGANLQGAWESVYVYDVALRIKDALAARTAAAVVMTTVDGTDVVADSRDVLPYSRAHAVQTTPPYAIADATIGVHLRWYLANSLFRRHTTKGSSDRMIFISVHADSLHPSLRGATAYIPNAASTAGSFGRSGAVFSSRKEYREQPTVAFSLAERQKSEGRSRDLAERIVAGFRGRTLAVHPFQPVRDRIFRGRRAWVPAVLRYNAVPAKLLLEVCNLANDEDRRLLQTRQYRDSLAAAVVDGILAYFGERK